VIQTQVFIKKEKEWWADMPWLESGQR